MPPLPAHILPLGGLGEIGMNCMAIEVADDLVVVDCGVKFADSSFGIDVVHPRFDWLAARRDKARAVLLTHGHEDHIGAVPYLLEELDCPVYAPPYALALLRRRFDELGLEHGHRLRTLRVNQRFGVGAMEVEAIRVTHSTPDAVALALHTKAGLLVHSGDFTIDPDPLDGEHFDLDAFRSLGDLGVSLALSDSTNVDHAERTVHERDVERELDQLIRTAPHRVVVVLFASNVGRVGVAMDVARKTGRHVALLGRSIGNHVEAALETKRLADPSGLLIASERAQEIPRDRLLVIASGSQGEPPAAISRIAGKRHPDLVLEPGDRVIFSSRTIPGNDRAVQRVIDELEQSGIEVRTATTDPQVHVSGHACRAEQRRFLDLIRPKAFLPVHGTFHHLARHAALARDFGVDHALAVTNGTELVLSDNRLSIVGEHATELVFRDHGEEVPEHIVTERTWLARQGVATVVIQMERDGDWVDVPAVVAHGFALESRKTLEDARHHVRRAVIRLVNRGHSLEAKDVEDLARRALRRYFVKTMGRSPVTVAQVSYQ